jgi:hypothetical protein
MSNKTTLVDRLRELSQEKYILNVMKVTDHVYLIDYTEKYNYWGIDVPYIREQEVFEEDDLTNVCQGKN